MGKGVSEFEEVGPGKVLAGIIQKIKKEASPLVVEEEPREEKKTPSSVPPSKEEGREAHAAVRAADGCPPAKAESFEVTPDLLGSEEYRKDYGIKYAYCAGGMYRGIASEDMVVRLAGSNLLGYFGTGGLTPDRIETAIRNIQSRVPDGGQYGVNIVNPYNRPELEEAVIDLFLKCGARNMEAAAYMAVSPALVRYRLNGLKRTPEGSVRIKNRIQAKISRPGAGPHILESAAATDRELLA
jgi:trans-AT polyketide synthase/acyltransferase/oxidoreductase domain-containing protein